MKVFIIISLGCFVLLALVAAGYLLNGLVSLGRRAVDVLRAVEDPGGECRE